MINLSSKGDEKVVGVSNFNRYKITDHAKQRYRERINEQATEQQILKGFRHHLSQAHFMAKERKGRESWFHSEMRIVIILNTEDYQIVTIYSSLKQLEEKRTEKKEVLVETKTKGSSGIETKMTNESDQIKNVVASKVSAMTKDYLNSETRKYFSDIAVLYSRIADRSDKLSKTYKPNVLDIKKKELFELKAKINKLEKEYGKIEKECYKYIIQEEV